MTEFKLGMIVFLLNFLIDSKNLRTERAGKIEAHWRQNLREGKDITSQGDLSPAPPWA
jgi:hypothetical protein